MSDHHSNDSDEQLDAYLDGQLGGRELEAFQSALQADHGLRERIELQGRIDARLRQIFDGAGASAEHLTELSERFQAARRLVPDRWHVATWVVGLAAAAVIGGVLLVWRPWSEGRREPFFQPQTVAQVYASALQSGFTPYYECRDADRFAEVFARRQSRPLQLLPLPDGVQMLGISYPGGLSRDSTAMLCRVDGQPVMVLVDRAQADRTEAARNCDAHLHVFREERDGLVFYEITPLEAPRVMEHLVAAPGA